MKTESRHFPAPRRHRASEGFTVVEILFVLGMLGVLAVLIQPYLTSSLEKIRLLGYSEKVAGLLQQAKAEAIVTGVPAVVIADFTTQEVWAFVDRDDALGNRGSDLQFNPSAGVDPRTGMPKTGRATDFVIGRLPLPGTDGSQPEVCFCGAEDGEPEGPNSIVGFTPDPRGPDYPNLLVFLPDGSIRDIGSLRVGVLDNETATTTIARASDTDRVGNMLEIHVGPQATANIELRKYLTEPAGMAGYYARDGVPEGGTWEWY